jgi:hypothetical protein
MKREGEGELMRGALTHRHPLFSRERDSTTFDRLAAKMKMRVGWVQNISFGLLATRQAHCVIGGPLHRLVSITMTKADLVLTRGDLWFAHPIGEFVNVLLHQRWIDLRHHGLLGDPLFQKLFRRWKKSKSSLWTESILGDTISRVRKDHFLEEAVLVYVDWLLSLTLTDFGFEKQFLSLVAISSAKFGQHLFLNEGELVAVVVILATQLQRSPVFVQKQTRSPHSILLQLVEGDPRGDPSEIGLRKIGSSPLSRTFHRTVVVRLWGWFVRVPEMGLSQAASRRGVVREF